MSTQIGKALATSLLVSLSHVMFVLQILGGISASLSAMGPHCDGTVRSIIDEKADLLQRSLDHIQLGIEEAQVRGICVVEVVNVPMKSHHDG